MRTTLQRFSLPLAIVLQAAVALGLARADGSEARAASAISSPVAWWNLDETSGTQAADASGNANHGTLHNMTDAAHVAGYLGNALQFDGADDYVLVPHDPSIDFGDEDFTVMFWLKESSPTDEERYLVKGTTGATEDPGTGKRYELYYKSSEVRFAIDDNVVKSQINVASSYFVTGDWVHVAAVRDTVADEIRLYTDGELRGSTADATGDISETEDLYLGRTSGGGVWFYGTIDDVRIYPSALTQAEILAICSEPAPQASAPTPSDGALHVGFDPTLTWTSGSLATSHDVYFGTDYASVANAGHSDPEFRGNLAVESYAPGTLDAMTYYYWRVDAVNASHPDSPWRGGVWTFRTAVGALAPAYSPHPLDGETNVRIDKTVNWRRSYGTTSHDVYFGTTDPPPFIGSQDIDSYTPGLLEPLTTYYWRIDSRTPTDMAEGPVWSFTTGNDPFPPGWLRVTAIESRVVPPTFPDVDFNLTDYGGVGDGTTTNTLAFIAAIDACHSAGGGRVVVPAGDWLTGPIHLKSNVNLHVSSGATLYFTTDTNDYEPLVLVRWEGTECYNYSPLIYAFRQENIAVTGEGTLNGQGGAWWPWKSTQQHNVLRTYGATDVPVEDRVMGDGYDLRPNMIQPFDCRNVLLEDFTILNSPMWTVHPTYCENVTVRNLSIYGSGPNTDGCNPESCEDVSIEDCYFNTGDDCIAVKAGRDRDGLRIGRPSENIVIRGCDMDEGHGAVTIGSEMSGSVRYMFAEDCVFDGAGMNTGLRFKTMPGRGGAMEHIYIRDITMYTIGSEAIKFNMLYGSGTGVLPAIRNFTIENVTCQSAGSYGLYMLGLPESPIRDVTLRNVTIDYAGTSTGIANVENLQMINVRINGEWFGVVENEDELSVPSAGWLLYE
ncbi:hypothetical protein JW916_07405 [Candidatus Sumerlaeota bacterium]|nr:hypothetical protein [Candidatus Sumerlaeota bacterium]